MFTQIPTKTGFFDCSNFHETALLRRPLCRLKPKEAFLMTSGCFSSPMNKPWTAPTIDKAIRIEIVANDTRILSHWIIIIITSSLFGGNVMPFSRGRGGEEKSKEWNYSEMSRSTMKMISDDIPNNECAYGCNRVSGILPARWIYNFFFFFLYLQP